VLYRVIGFPSKGPSTQNSHREGKKHTRKKKEKNPSETAIISSKYHKSS